MTERHEVVCDLCGKTAPMEYHTYSIGLVKPDGWQTEETRDYKTLHFCSYAHRRQYLIDHP